MTIQRVPDDELLIAYLLNWAEEHLSMNRIRTFLDEYHQSSTLSDHSYEELMRIYKEEKG